MQIAWLETGLKSRRWLVIKMRDVLAGLRTDRINLDEPTIPDPEIAQFHILAHAKAWVALGQPIEMRVPTLKSFTRMREPHDRNNPLHGRLKGLQVSSSSGTVLETAIGLTDASPIEVLSARVACYISPETVSESAEVLAYLLSAAIAKLQDEGSIGEDGGINPALLLDAADSILHQFIDLENSFFLSHIMRFAIVQDHIQLVHREQLERFARMLAEFFAMIHGPLPEIQEADETAPETGEQANCGDEEAEPSASGMTQEDAFHMVRLIAVIEQRMFSRVAAQGGAHAAKRIARPGPANVTRMPLPNDARAAQIARANDIVSRTANPDHLGITRDATVQLAQLLERIMGTERAKRFCEMSYWAFHDDGDVKNADMWEIMRAFMDIEFLCQLGRPFHLEHFRRDIEIISDEHGARVVFNGGASISFAGIRSLFRPSLGNAI